MPLRNLLSALILFVVLAASPAQAVVLSTFDGAEHGDLEVGLEVVSSPGAFAGVFEFTLSSLSEISFEATTNSDVGVSVSLISDAAGTITELILDSGVSTVKSTLSLDAGSYSYVFSSADATLGNSLSLTSSVVPEPSVYAMLLSGLAIVGFSARRRKSQK